MAESAHERVRNWLESVIENSERAVDSGWTVEVDGDNPTVMLVDSEKTPFKITVVAGEDITYLAFVTNLQLALLDAKLLAPALKEMLVKNREADFVKFCLMDPNDTVMLRTDLYSKHMSKNEFNTALEYLILLGRWFIAELERGEDLNSRMDELDRLAAAALLKGEDPEEVKDNLVRVGVEEKKAGDIVNRLLAMLEIEAEGGGGGEMVAIAEVPRTNKGAKDSPVDNYIW